MHKKQAGIALELSNRAGGKYVEPEHCETTKEIYQTIHNSGLNKLTFSLIDSSWKELNTILHHLELLSELEFKVLMEVIDGLSEARNELRHARFLFDVEEISPVYRLLMRNRAALRGKQILQKTLRIWPLRSSTLVEWDNP